MTAEVRDFPQVVDGSVGPAASGEWIDSVDPATGRRWARVPRSGPADVEAAVDAARRAFPGWWGLPALGRAAHLRAVAAVVAAHQDELAEIETRDNGRIRNETALGDLPACVQMFHYFAGAADKISGDTVVVGPASFNFTRREPFGVVGVVIPWNAPLSLMSAKVGAALAAGNTVVVKAAEQAAGSVLRWAALLEEAGLPAGVVNVVAGLGEEAGDALVRDPRVGRVTFTGSTATARVIQARSAHLIRPLHVELGGKSANLVFSDADLDAAAVGVSTAAVFTGGAGQTCVAGSRILVHESVLDDVVERVRAVAAHVVLGDPMDPATTMGPLVSDVQLERVRDFVAGAPADGAELLFGGRGGGEALFGAGSPFAGGSWMEPTLLRVADNAPRICREEVFGPVAVVMAFSDDDEALALANDSAYGLAAGVWTNDLKRAHRMVRDLDAGSVWVNAYRRIHWALPFGGFGDSGFGKDSGWESVLENTRLKTSWIDLA
ncbi:MAG: aldehyde dehydrogenase family protein [Actinomycetes bacterium]